MFIKSPVLCCGEDITFNQVAKFTVPLQTSENVYHLPPIAFPLPVVRAAFCIRLPSDFTSGILRFH
ncbi:hypothetical protein C2372_22295 [Escherichia coli]|nr:hypothetical protein [Escherichia coli]EFO0235426.1 hypothetical protein [Escherichia coli]EFO4223071.1 hypothetical protein [Escherichia coli]